MLNELINSSKFFIKLNYKLENFLNEFNQFLNIQ